MTDALPMAILAGGLATRLRPLTERIPKVLVKVAGEPFLAHQLRLLAANGVRRLVLCTGFLGEMVEDWAGDGSRFGVSISYSPDGPAPRGTGGAIRQALPLLGETFFVMYGDSYLPCDYAAVQRHFLASGKLGLMTVYRNEGRWDTSNVEFSQGGILVYDKKNRSPRMQHIDYGLGILDRRALEAFSGEDFFDLASLYQALVSQRQMAAFEAGQRFYEIGSFAGLQEFESYIREQSQ
jgi:NDP-sugar pyrophosphorylase family protein